MLNKSKIESLINSEGSNKNKVSKGINMPYSTLNSKIDAGSWTPDDIEKLADHFNKPIAYFFDREETQSTVEEPSAEYRRKCLQCEEKDKRIIELQNKLLAIYEKERGDDLNGEVQEAKVS